MLLGALAVFKWLIMLLYDLESLLLQDPDNCSLQYILSHYTTGEAVVEPIV